MVRSRSTSVNPFTVNDVRDHDVDPLFMVWLVARSTEDLLDMVLAGTDVRGSEFAIYSVLAASPGITPTELSRWMAAPATSVSSYVKRLERRGHVTRRPDSKDRRSYGIHLTAAGRRTHQAARELFGPFRARVIATLGDQQGSVGESLLRLRRIVDDLRSDFDEAHHP